MTDNAAGFDFSKFIPGFDFLQQMTQPNQATPGLSQWIAPTLDPDEIGKRIQELKTVQFWLEQNATALKATIQALEVQRLTCSTLKNMNAQMTDVASSMQAAMQNPSEQDAPTDTNTDTPEKTEDAGNNMPELDTAALQNAMEQTGQWWGGLLQTFQDIAEQAQSEVQQRQEEFMEAATPKPAKKPATTQRKAASSKAKTASAKPARAKTTAAKASTRSRTSSKASARSKPKKT